MRKKKMISGIMAKRVYEKYGRKGHNNKNERKGQIIRMKEWS